MRFENDTIELNGLAQLTKALKSKNPPHIEVGIISKNNRTDSKSGNAEIGAAHEYGAPAINLPSRSFLRMSMRDHLQEEMESSGLIGENELKAVIEKGTIRPWLNQVAKIAKRTVLKAFDTEGWGTWKPWADPDYTNNTMMILQDTQQLRDAQDAQVVD